MRQLQLGEQSREAMFRVGAMVVLGCAAFWGAAAAAALALITL